MRPLFKEYLKEHIKVAVGWEESGWYVQTTDVALDTYYSEPIQSGLKTRREALAIAKHYADVYDLKIEVWDQGP